MKSWILLFAISIFKVEASDLNPFKISIQASHQIILLNYGLGSFEERLQMIEKAKKSIDVEYYIYNLDKSGRIISQALIKKAHEGVKVRLLLDYFMARNQFSPFYAHEMEKNGIIVKYFNTAVFNLVKDQYRNHRKVLLIDGKEAITGGRNIGDEYFDLREDFNFLDRDIFVSGPIVSYMQDTFDTIWNSDISEKVERKKEPLPTDATYKTEQDGIGELRYRNDLKDYKQKVANAVEFLYAPSTQLDEIRIKGKSELESEYHGTCENMSFNSEYPIIGRRNRSERIIKHDIEERITNAKESILFDTPYFIVNDEARSTLENAFDKKLKITLLTNSLYSTDAFYVYSAFDTTIHHWINEGLETNIFKGVIPENYPSMTDKIAHARFGIHAKSFVFDNKDVVIGSFNFDPRSANFNAEMTLTCNDNPELARLVTEDIEGKIKKSILLDSKDAVTDAKFYNTNFLKIFEYYIVKIPSNLFSYLL